MQRPLDEWDSNKMGLGQCGGGGVGEIKMRLWKQLKDTRQGGDKASPEQVRTGLGATPSSRSEVYSEEEYEPSSNDYQETPTAHDAC